MLAILTTILALCAFLQWPGSDLQRARAATDGYLHTDGNRILDSEGNEVHLSGLNWFGFETGNHVVHGLWTRNWQDMLDEIKQLGYNVIRLPFSDELLDSGKMPDSIDYNKNPDLQGLNSFQIFDKIIEGAGQRGIKIILDNHRSNAGVSAQENGLWYTSAYPESRWISDWEFLAQHYLNNEAVIGADLRNEPHDSACWGCGDPQLDWRLAAEKAGNAILSINPHWLILVEGNECYGPNGISDPYQGADCTWWGGNLQGAQDYPVQLNVAHQLVYSPHEYPASVYPQSWFSDSNYPDNLPDIWDHQWGYLHDNGTAPILIGEFGSRLSTASDQIWFDAFADYIRANGLNWTFWSLNPDSGDTGGLYSDDWVTVNQAKQSVLSTIQYPLIGSGGSSTGSPAAPGGLIAVSGNAQVDLSWSASSGATSYNVKRSTVSGGSYATVATGVANANYSDTDVVNGTTYYYVVSAVNSEGESGNSGQVSATPQASGGGGTTSDLALQYRAADTNAGDNQMKPHFRIANHGGAAMNLSDLTIRYWYTIDGAQPQTFNCDYAAVGCGNVNGQLVQMGAAKTGADYYIEIGFASGAGSIAPGSDSGEIQTRINKNNWSNYSEGDDYSYDPTKTSFADWNKAGLYQNGVLVSGIEP